MTDDVDDVAVRRLINGDRSIPLYRRVPGRRGRRLSPDVVEAIRLMAASGMSDRQIGERLGRSREAVLKARCRHLVPSARPRTTGRSELLAALIDEWYGPRHIAELERPPDGGPDTPAAINSRRRVLQALDTEEENT